MAGIDNVTELNQAILAADALTSGSYTIELAAGATIELTSALEAINLHSGVTLDIEGDGATLDGANPITDVSDNQRGLFVYSGTVTVEDLTIENMKAIGTPGGSSAGGDFGGGDYGGGGGGAGLGGGLFVADNTAGGAMHAGAVTLDNVNFLNDSATGGAGGASVGGIPGPGGKGGGLGATVPSDGGFGLGGAGGNTGRSGGAGGFGGGGGGGAGGPGGSGGSPGRGGFGAQSGGYGGGGGLGAGGDIFVMGGAALTIKGGSLSGGAVSGGADGASHFGSGSAFGSGIFLQGAENLTFTPAAGQTATVSDVVADQTGSGGKGTNAGVGSLTLNGPGTLQLNAANTFTGGVTIDQGTLLLGNASGAGSGAIAFASNASATLALAAGVDPANTILGFDRTDRIDLQGFGTSATATLGANNLLTVTGASGKETLKLDPSGNYSGFEAWSDGAGGVLVTFPTIPSQTLSGPYGPYAAVPGVEIGLSGLSVSASPNASDPLTTVVSVSDGTISVDGQTGSSVTLNGTAAEIDAQLAKGVGYFPVDWGTFILSMLTTDTADNLSASNSTFFEVYGSAVTQVSPTAISFGNLRVGDSPTQALSIGNIASYGAATLDVSISTSGAATASQSSAKLPPQNSDMGLSVGLDTSKAGAQSGAVTLNFSSDFDSSFVTPLGSQTVQVSGNVYREATASVTVDNSNLYLHVGDQANDQLSIANTAANDGYSENLIASITDSTGGFIPFLSTTGDIAAGSTSDAIALGLSTASAGSFNGAVTLDLQSDGSGIDALGTVDLGRQTFNISATVYNYASAALAEVTGPGALGGDAANGYTLDLGTVQLGASAPSASLKVLNAATGLSDQLKGSFETGGADSTAFTNDFQAFEGLAAGRSDTGLSVTLNTSQAGTFSETITLYPTGYNNAIVSDGNGYSRTLSPETLTVTGTVMADDSICFMAGTLVRTPAGEVAVETLKRGDLVLTAEGFARPVSWLGRQTISSRFADPLRSWPIRVKAGALGENVPCRDLLLSPDHALLVDDVLIHAGALVNGTSIVRETLVPEVFIYYHVELDDHSLILAENTPAETFVDNVERLAFDNWAEHEAHYPEGKPVEELPYPRAKGRRQVPMHIRAALDQRAKFIGAVEISAVA